MRAAQVRLSQLHNPLLAPLRTQSALFVIGSYCEMPIKLYTLALFNSLEMMLLHFLQTTLTYPQIAGTNDIGCSCFDIFSTKSTVTFDGVWVRNTGAPTYIGNERDLGGKGVIGRQLY
jgi:hypothetical protein